MKVLVNCIINIFTIMDGNINLLCKSNGELIKVNCYDDLDLTCKKYIDENISIKDLNLTQQYTFSKKGENLELTILYCGIVNSSNISINDKFKFIEIDNLDINNIYIYKSIHYLRNSLIIMGNVKQLYPEEFVLPDLQKMYEKLFNKKYDRRNFRKKLIKYDVIESLDKVSPNSNGRPAKLYSFKSSNENVTLI